MSLCVRYAGDSYRYLLDSVTTDHGRTGTSPMTHYYAAAGAPPGTWLVLMAHTGRYCGSFETRFEADVARLAGCAGDADGFVRALDKVINDTTTADYWSITLPNLTSLRPRLQSRPRCSHISPP